MPFPIPRIAPPPPLWLTSVALNISQAPALAVVSAFPVAPEILSGLCHLVRRSAHTSCPAATGKQNNSLPWLFSGIYFPFVTPADRTSELPFPPWSFYYHLVTVLCVHLPHWSELPLRGSRHRKAIESTHPESQERGKGATVNRHKQKPWPSQPAASTSSR